MHSATRHGRLAGIALERLAMLDSQTRFVYEGAIALGYRCQLASMAPLYGKNILAL